jgi:ceramide glucosyltransferase
VRFYPFMAPSARVVNLLFSAGMESLFDILAVLQILLGSYLIVQGLQWLAYVRKRAGADPGFYTPRTAVLCPCKGLEPGLEPNLAALCEFTHPNYEVFFILASESDPAHSVIRRVVAHSHAKAHVVIAGKPEGCGEKVNNLRVAVEQLPPDFDVLVFTDSDGRPGRSWLHHLVAPLIDGSIGAATTMRWLVPNRANFATLLLAAWNAPIVTMLSEKGKNFCWGGGTAIRRTIFEQIGVAEDWRHSISDDYSMTRALERTRRRILFVPECLTLSYVETGFAGLLEFTNRQIVITRVYAGKMWASAAATHLLFCLTFVLGITLTLGNIEGSLPSLQLAGLTFLPLLLAAIRGGMRVSGVTEVAPSARGQIQGQSWIYVVLGVFIPFLYLLNFAVSVMTRKVRWRDVLYELISPNQTKVLRYNP